MKSMNVRSIGILNIKSADYCCIISGINKNEAKNWNIIKHKKL